MRMTRTERRRTAPRLGAAAVLATLLVASTITVSAAKTTKADLDAAKADLVSMNAKLSSLVETYDQAQVALQGTQKRLAAAQTAMDQAQAAADQARAYFSMRAAQAYEGAGSEIEALLGAGTFSDFADRVEFLNSLAQDDVDAATQAQVAGERAHQASVRLTQAVSDRKALLARLSSQKTDIQNAIADQQALVARLQKELDAQALAAIMNDPGPRQQNTGGGDPNPQPSPPPSPPPPPPPPPPSGNGAQAVAAALSVLGVPYVWGGADPNVGFDCSGLTMWSWAQAGVSLPHSSALQYEVTARVSKADLQPGDLLFFYSPISHVAMYIGNNQMVHATHPGTVVHTETISSYWWAVYQGAGRP
jgi:cell wall-associated NlpC family hydrolase